MLRNCNELTVFLYRFKLHQFNRKHLIIMGKNGYLFSKKFYTKLIIYKTHFDFKKHTVTNIG